VFDYILLIFCNSLQHNEDVSTESYMDPMLCLNHGIVHLHIMAAICSASVVYTVHCIFLFCSMSLFFVLIGSSFTIVTVVGGTVCMQYIIV